MRLEGKTAVITGAASGMGKAIAERFADEGAKVAAVDINKEGVKTVADTIASNGGIASGIAADITRRADIENMIDTAAATHGTIDILVNNAGVMDGMEAAGDISDDKWDLLFDINTKAVMRAIRHALPIFLEKQKGVIINTASTGGLNGAHAGAAYTASKHAVVGLTKNTGFMYAEQGIRCNAIAPGGVQTNIQSSIHDVSEFGAGRTQLTQSVMPRAGEPDDIAALAVFLASDEASFINGTVITADAGWTAGF
ncbi:SDR family oxidoreductase [Salibacterium halotolerans]|uniref:NAD(P)-dependent dehydrogenase, short-chain alcohol dehydrogenase family n=1 Tax=Salibacterium halotolerans TaxID=1884432 RepID=A0A1I5W1M4_9BACI|nr:SDR family oxidoreductase [Salibacterium halotolerans]SFQ13580.1 NAD(P)-dependent dehydrogenase, short-chain alcohol dehydrogenase family [Salibacterium halotolerans]